MQWQTFGMAVALGLGGVAVAASQVDASREGPLRVGFVDVERVLRECKRALADAEARAERAQRFQTRLSAEVTAYEDLKNELELLPRATAVYWEKLQAASLKEREIEFLQQRERVERARAHTRDRAEVLRSPLGAGVFADADGRDGSGSGGL